MAEARLDASMAASAREREAPVLDRARPCILAMPSMPIAMMMSATMTSTNVKPESRRGVEKVVISIRSLPQKHPIAPCLARQKRRPRRHRVYEEVAVESCNVNFGAVPKPDAKPSRLKVMGEEPAALVRVSVLLKLENGSPRRSTIAVPPVAAEFDSTIQPLLQVALAVQVTAEAPAGQTCTGRTLFHRLVARKLHVAEERVDFVGHTVRFRHVSVGRYADRGEDGGDTDHHQELDQCHAGLKIRFHGATLPRKACTKLSAARQRPESCTRVTVNL